MAPIVEELASEYKGRVVIGKCDVDESEALAVQFRIRNVPTTLFIKDGKLVDKLVGAVDKQTLSAKIETLIK
jgi:thioredoxin 1